MAVFISAFDKTSALGVSNWTSDDVNCERAALVGCLVSSDNNLTLNFLWSNDGITTVLTDTEAIVGGTPAEFYRGIKAKYLNLQLVNSGTNNTLVLQGFFFDLASAILAVRNLGTGAPIANLSKFGLRSLNSSDASVTITPSSTEINLQVPVPVATTLTSAGGTETLVNDGTGPTLATKGLTAGTNITLSSTASAITLNNAMTLAEDAYGDLKITPSGSTYNFSVGAKAVATSVIINRTVSTGGNNVSRVAIGDQAGDTSVGARSVCIGYQCGRTLGQDSTVVGSQSGTNSGSRCLLMGYGVGLSSGESCVALGRACGETTQGDYAVAIGYESGKTSQGTNSVCIGQRAGRNSVASGCICLGLDAGNLGCGINSVAVGNNAGFYYLLTNSVAIGSKAALGTSGGVNSGSSTVYVGAESGTNAGAGKAANNGNNCICLGYRAGGGATSLGTSEICIGTNCAATGVTGRLSLGNSMEAIQTTATAGAQTLPANPTGFMRISHNGTLYKIPLYSD
jgi:hypothetical protein